MIHERAAGVTTVFRHLKYTTTAMIYFAGAACVERGTVPVTTLLLTAAFLCVSWIAFGSSFPFRDRVFAPRQWRAAIWCAVHETVIALVCLYTIQPLLSMNTPGLVSWIGFAIASVCVLTVTNHWLPDLIARLLFPESRRLRILILGELQAAIALRKRLSSAGRLGICFLTGNPQPAQSTLKLFVPESGDLPCHDLVGTPRECLLTALQSGPVHEVTLVCDCRDDGLNAVRQEIEQLCDEHGVRLSRSFEETSPGESVPGRDLRQTRFGEAQRDHLMNPLNQAAKRMLDILFAIPVVVIVLPPLCVAVRIMLWIQSRGPLFYRQERAGKDGVPFQILKFRTMHVSHLEHNDVSSSRIFPVGALMRDSRLDEIPQFVNVLLGSMSIVGPRAHHAADRVRFQRIVRHYPMRTVVKPGITGLAQYREFLRIFNRNCVESRVRSDMEYINTWSIRADVSLIIRSCRIIPESLIRSIFRRTSRKAPAMVPEVTPELPAELQSGKQAA